MDRKEKVLKGLECCLNKTTGCEDCPYYEAWFCINKLMIDCKDIVLSSNDTKVITKAK